MNCVCLFAVPGTNEEVDPTMPPKQSRPGKLFAPETMKWKKLSGLYAKGNCLSLDFFV